MNADFQSEKALESYLGFLIDHELHHIYADVPINRTLAENKTSFVRQNPKEAKNISPLAPNLRLASSQGQPVNVASLRQNATDLVASLSSIEALYTYLEDGLDNSLKLESGNRMVKGRGNEQPDLLVISDLPSEEDIVQGQILSGPSGHLFDKALRASGLTEKTYISPCLFWRPLGARHIGALEIAQNAPLLEAVVRILAPKAILMLGSVGANLLLNVDQTLTRLRGRIIQHSDKSLHRTVPIMVSFPPAFLIQQAAAKALFWRDLLALKASLHKAH